MIASRYPGFDVMVLKDEWDEHTRHVIDQRMRPPEAPRFFTAGEAGALRAACARLLAETDNWLLDKVVEEIDTRLADGSGEGYRPEEQPPEAAFWRAGVGSLGEGFAGAPPEQQDQRLKALQQEDPPFFKALLKQAMTGYCSLPPVWSFMGYGGPAFPRGYVRIELGLTDPWEAKQHEHR